MGGATSKTVVEQISESVTEISMSTVQSCETLVQQNQEATINNSGFWFWSTIKYKQGTEISVNCFSDVNKQSQLQNDITNAIIQKTSAENVGILGAFGSSTSEAKSKITNIVKNYVTMSNIQKTYNSIMQTQKVNITNSGLIAGVDIDAIQGAEVFAEATLTELTKSGIFNTISSATSQESSATVENPFEFIVRAIDSVVSGVTNITLGVWAILIFAIFGVFFLGAAGGGGDGGGSDEPGDQITYNTTYATTPQSQGYETY